jgi:hypothetical protein
MIQPHREVAGNGIQSRIQDMLGCTGNKAPYRRGSLAKTNLYSGCFNFHLNGVDPMPESSLGISRTSKTSREWRGYCGL